MEHSVASGLIQMALTQEAPPNKPLHLNTEACHER